MHFQVVAKPFTRSEGWKILFADCDLVTSAGIATGMRIALFDPERAETAQLDAIAAR
jgi:hypothetical protein